jgi:hypothetical protein
VSWITVQYGNATHSPQHILLYHGTEYLGTATSEPQPYLPQIESTGGDTLTVGYPYAAPGQDPATANPRDRHPISSDGVPICHQPRPAGSDQSRSGSRARRSGAGREVALVHDGLRRLIPGEGRDRIAAICHQPRWPGRLEALSAAQPLQPGEPWTRTRPLSR